MTVLLSGYLALGSGVASSFVEIGAGGYSRAAITVSLLSPGQYSISPGLTFSAGAAWPTATQFAVCDGSGNILCWWMMESPFALASGASKSIASGTLKLTLPDLAPSGGLASVSWAAGITIGKAGNGNSVTAQRALSIFGGALSSATLISTAFKGRSKIITEPSVVFPPRSLYNGTYTSGGGSDLGGTAQYSCYAMYSCSGVRFVFANVAMNQGFPNGEYTTGLSAITLSVSVNYPLSNSGWRYVTFNGGATSVVLQPGAMIVSDEVPMTLAQYGEFFYRTYVQVPSGGQFPVGAETNAYAATAPAVSGLNPNLVLDSTTYCGQNYVQNGTGNGYNTGANCLFTAGVDSSGANGGTKWLGNWLGYGYGALAIIGTPSTGANVPVIGIIGDSNAMGLADQGGELGYILRAVTNAGLTAHQLCLSGDWGANFAVLTNRLLRQRLLEGCTHAVNEHSSNDIYDESRTLAQVQASTLAIGYACQTAGVLVWQTTCLPKTTSSNGFVTAGAQTVESGESVRVAFNTWVRAGMPQIGGVAVAIGAPGAVLAGQPGHPFSGFFDPAALIEVNSANAFSLNGGFWYCGPLNNTAYTEEGTHYIQNAALILEASINTAAFAVN